jgi:large subunit ribosomal protein L4
MKKPVIGLDGKELRQINLGDDVFNVPVSEGTIYYAIRNEEANARVGTASTKTRGEVRGSHRKPWRQKGIGRARAGRRQSPIWVGGGITFGPKPRDYHYRMPRKAKRMAIKSILTKKNQEDQLRIVEDFNVPSGKTKELVALLKPLVSERKTVLILPDDGAMMKRAGSNVPWLGLLSYNRLRAKDLYYGGDLLIQETAAKKLNDFYGKKRGEG